MKLIPVQLAPVSPRAGFSPLTQPKSTRSPSDRRYPPGVALLTAAAAPPLSFLPLEPHAPPLGFPPLELRAPPAAPPPLAAQLSRDRPPAARSLRQAAQKPQAPRGSASGCGRWCPARLIARGDRPHRPALATPAASTHTARAQKRLSTPGALTGLPEHGSC